MTCTHPSLSYSCSTCPSPSSLASCSLSTSPTSTSYLSTSSNSLIPDVSPSIYSIPPLSFQSTENQFVKRKQSRPLPKIPLDTTGGTRPTSRIRPLPTPPTSATRTSPTPFISVLSYPHIPEVVPPRKDSLQVSTSHAESRSLFNFPPSLELTPLPSPTLSLPLNFDTSPAQSPRDDPPPILGPIIGDIQAHSEKSEAKLAQRLSELGFVEVVITPDETETLSLPTQECVVRLEQPPITVPAIFCNSSSKPETLKASPFRFRRYSRKWIREKKGKRWVETNYQEVLRALREL